MTDKPISLAAARVKRDQDANKWTVAEMLEETLRQSEPEGWTKALVLLYREDETGDTFALDWRSAGTTTLERRGLLLTAMTAENED